MLFSTNSLSTKFALNSEQLINNSKIVEIPNFCIKSCTIAGGSQFEKLLRNYHIKLKMKFIVAISLLIIGVAYTIALPVSGGEIASDVDLGVGIPMAQLKAENAGKSNMGATVNSLKTVAKGTAKGTDLFFKMVQLKLIVFIIYSATCLGHG